MQLFSEVQPHLQRDFISLLPEEISIQILSLVDINSLCNANLVCRTWRNLVNDNM